MIVTDITRVNGKSQYFWTYYAYLVPKVDSAWSSTQLACGFHEGESNALGFIVTLTADMVLLLIIFSGLLVIRFRGGGAFGLTRVLWKQVRFSLAADLLFR